MAILKSLDHRDAQARLREWTRDRFALPPAAMILVAERPCEIPGGPPVETLVGFWTDEEARYHFRIFKPLAAIAAADLPFAWQKDALAVPPDWQCECC
jgi:hypothetical protein